MTDISSWTALETAEQIRNKEVSVTEVIEASLRVIGQVNPIINALPEVHEESLQQAQAMDNNFPRGEVPPLFGVPVTTKINVDQAGSINSNGVQAFAENHCDADSVVVANLKNSGAVIVGRSNTPEFSMRWCTSNPLHGVSLNPWNHDITPGGSSGAAAAAVATGMCAIAHGNDLGGSLRYPAFCCGVASIKPTAGRVPAFNPGAKLERPPITQTMSVQGPIARCVGDLRLGLNAMAVPSSLDPLCLDAMSARTPVSRPGSAKPRVGYALNPFDSAIDSSLIDAMTTAVNGMRDADIEVIERNPPDVELAVRLWGELLFTETTELMGDAIRAHGSPEMQQLVSAYETRFGKLDVAGLLAAMSKRIEQQRAWACMFSDIDAFLMPTSLQLPFKNDLDFTSPKDIPWILDAQKPLFVVNLLGLPSVAIPTGVVDGIPVGVQLIGARQEDLFVLDLAERLEQEIGTILGELPNG